MDTTAATPLSAAEALAIRAEELVEENRYTEAVDLLSGADSHAGADTDLAVRLLLTEGWALMYLGALDEAFARVERARALAESHGLAAETRAEALFRLGCCRLKQGRVSTAADLFSAALELSRTSLHACETLQARILDWRSRTHQAHREWEAAQADAERSLELAELVGDRKLASHALMQCSLVAERLGESWTARYYAERAQKLAHEAGDRQTEARILNNLGGLSFQLGEREAAIVSLEEAYSLSLDVGNEADAAQAISSLAQIHLLSCDPKRAEDFARHALGILMLREDYRDECGNVRLVLGRALLEQGRTEEALSEFTTAEKVFERLGSLSLLAAAWRAQADVRIASGDPDGAAALYRRAVDALQDFHF